MKLFLSLIAAMAIAGTASAQITVLDEDFSTWTWVNANNNAAVSQGWIHDFGGQRAWHEDELGGHTADNTLVGPAMDLTGLTNVYAHIAGSTGFATYMANHPSSVGDGVSTFEVSTDGGLTWAVLWTDTSLINGAPFTADIDLSAFAGMTGVQIGLHYYGTYAHEAWFSSVLVNDDPVGPPPSGSMWTVNLPTAFASAPFVEDFEAGAGTVPSHMALTNIDPTTGLTDVEAWCNVGQLAPCMNPNGGLFALEMGLDPFSANYHNVRNAMVLGINGGGATGLALDFMGYNAGEETNDFDGVWVSEDGAEWFKVSGPWSFELPVLSLWTSVAGMDLSGTPVNTSGDFYLMFGQEDNFPYDYLDGIGIDGIAVANNGPPPLTYTVTGLVGGGTVTLTVTGATAGGGVLLGYSLTGAGPTMTPFGLADMSAPITTLPALTANATGVATLSTSVPSRASGFTVYTQGADLGTSTLTNSLAEVIL
jgi:hypothetical protein